MNIHLIGYRCCGKSSLGRLLAEALGWTFVDMDALVMKRAGQDIAAIVQKEGWNRFRQLERESLLSVTVKQQQVVATGGGIVLDPENVKALKTSGVVIWLTALPATIRWRMRADADTEYLRPALSGSRADDEIETVLEQREPLYRAASDIELPTDHASIQVLVRKLIVQLKPMMGSKDKTTQLHLRSNR